MLKRGLSPKSLYQTYMSDMAYEELVSARHI